MSTSTDHRAAPDAAGGDRCDATLRRSRTIDRARLGGGLIRVAFVAAFVAAIGQAAGALVVGRLAVDPRQSTVGVLALCVVGASVADVIGRVAWANAVDRAEGRLRADLLDAVLHQPVSSLSDNAVGEYLDRIDDDTHQLGSLLRLNTWRLVRLTFAAGPLLIVAGLSWWPAWLLFPAASLLVWFAIRPLLARITESTVTEEEAWSDQAAAMEEAVAAADDLRTSLGQAYAIGRDAERTAEVHRRFDALALAEAAVIRRAGWILYGLLGLVIAVGVALVENDALGVEALVTLVAVTITFVGQFDQVAHQIPELQAGVGALIRLRDLIAVEAEPTGGRPVPDGPLSVEFRDLRFAYGDGGFTLSGITVDVAAGTTCAVVGRSGSGKTTLASLLSRAVEPPPGTVFVGGVDVTELDLDDLRSVVGVVTQRTEILAGSVLDNVTMFADVERSRVDDAVERLGLDEWIAGLPDGIDTPVGPSGLTLSAGEQQLLAFLRLLIRDVRVVVLDEATARMDPMTEQRVVEAFERLFADRTGILIAHRLSTTERAEQVIVLDDGQVVESGRRTELARGDGPFRRLLDDASSTTTPASATPSTEAGGTRTAAVRRTGVAPEIDDVAPPSLFRTVLHSMMIHPRWGLTSIAAFVTAAAFGAFGAVTGWLWGDIAERLEDGRRATPLVVVLVVGFVVAPVLMGHAVRFYSHWWIAVMLRVRHAVLLGRTEQHRLKQAPAGEVVARALDSDRYAMYVDRWFDVLNGLVIAASTAVFAGTWVAGAVLLVVMGVTAVSSRLGAPLAGRTAAASSTARAGFGRSLVSALDAIRTVKLSGATADIHAHLHAVDAGRVDAAVSEHRVQSVLDGVPIVLVQCGVVVAWGFHASGRWSLSTTLLVSGAIVGFEYFGRVAGAVITEAPGVRAWQQETSRLAGGRDLMTLGHGVDLVAGDAPAPAPGAVDRFVALDLDDLAAIHDDGTIGVSGVDLHVERGELVLLVGRVGSGKSSLLGALAGLVHTTGSITWNGTVVDDPEHELRPGRVSYVGQAPRVMSGTVADNITLGHSRDLDGPIGDARLERDVAAAGGTDAVVGHRGVRLSGGQVQRVALARALAADAEVLVADDVSSALDATTEVELWETMRASGRTVIGSTSKRAALERADRVVVLDGGTMVASGRWRDLTDRWDHLAG